MEKLPVDKIYSQSIVIPFHKNKALLEYSLNTLMSTIPSQVEIIVVANNIDSREIDLNLEYDNLRIIKINDNLLYSKAANIGVSAASGEIVTLCDQDLFYEENWYTELLNFLINHPRAGAVSAKLLNPHNNRIIDFGIAYSKQTIVHPSRGMKADHPLVKNNRKVSSACGAVLMTYKKLYEEVGGMDLSMPYICCDCDYGIQLQKRNLETWVISSSIVYHIGNSSRANTKISSYEYLRSDSKAMFFAKDYHFIQTDLPDWINKNVNFFLQEHDMRKYYYLFNLSLVSDFEWYKEHIMHLMDVEFYDIFNININNALSNNTISLYNIMPLSMLNVNEPIIYFVDSFCHLFDNYYWWKMRNYWNDIIIDQHGNIFHAKNIVERTC